MYSNWLKEPITGLWLEGMLSAVVYDMAVVLISWVSMSVVFCLALVRAAARRYSRDARSKTSTIVAGPTPAIVHHKTLKEAPAAQFSAAM